MMAKLSVGICKGCDVDYYSMVDKEIKRNQWASKLVVFYYSVHIECLKSFELALQMDKIRVFKDGFDKIYEKRF